MKQLKSTYKELRELFENEIKIKHIAEDLKCCTYEDSSITVKNQMEYYDFDVMGIKNRGKIIGFIYRSDLKNGAVKKYRKTFGVSDLIDESLPLIQVFATLSNSPRKFVTRNSEVIGIVTRGDLQKAPVRMWLFGLISLLEMHLLRIIRHYFEGDTWQVNLKEKRIKEAKKICSMRKERNEELDLADCLQFCDKSHLIFEIQVVKELMEEKWGKSAKKRLRSVQSLRDKLFHAQDLVAGKTWLEVIDLVKTIECFLAFFESID
ncbi:MAG: hypothetical protein NUK62_08235 [Tenericutes bacterium]|nr:hypothetical protein [Mycoplasmatota bacterium]